MESIAEIESRSWTGEVYNSGNVRHVFVVRRESINGVEVEEVKTNFCRPKAHRKKA